MNLTYCPTCRRYTEFCTHEVDLSGYDTARAIFGLEIMNVLLAKGYAVSVPASDSEYARAAMQAVRELPEHWSDKDV